MGTVKVLTSPEETIVSLSEEQALDELLLASRLSVLARDSFKNSFFRLMSIGIIIFISISGGADPLMLLKGILLYLVLGCAIDLCMRGITIKRYQKARMGWMKRVSEENSTWVDTEISGN